MMLAAIWRIERCPSPLTTPSWMGDVIHLKATECIYQPALGLAYKWRFHYFIWGILQFTKRCPQNTGFRYITSTPEHRNCETPPQQTQTTAAFRGTSAHRFAPSHPNSQERNTESCRSSANSQEFNSLHVYLLEPVPAPLCSLSCFSGWVRELQGKEAHELRHSATTQSYCHPSFSSQRVCGHAAVVMTWSTISRCFQLPSPLQQLPFSLGLGLVLTILLQNQLWVAFTTEVNNEVSNNYFISSKESPLQRTKTPQLSCKNITL